MPHEPIFFACRSSSSSKINAMTVIIPSPKSPSQKYGYCAWQKGIIGWVKKFSDTGRRHFGFGKMTWLCRDMRVNRILMHWDYFWLYQGPGIIFHSLKVLTIFFTQLGCWEYFWLLIYWEFFTSFVFLCLLNLDLSKVVWVTISVMMNLTYPSALIGVQR